MTGCAVWSTTEVAEDTENRHEHGAGFSVLTVTSAENAVEPLPAIAS